MTAADLEERDDIWYMPRGFCSGPSGKKHSTQDTAVDLRARATVNQPFLELGAKMGLSLSVSVSVCLSGIKLKNGTSTFGSGSRNSFQVAVPSGPRYRGEEARMTNADWGRPGNLTFTIR